VSRIDQLIAERCPRGVEFRTLGSLGRRNKGTSITAAQMKQLHVSGGPVKVFAGGATEADVEEAAVPAQSAIREPSIIVRSRGHVGFTYYDRPFTHKSELWSYTLTDPSVDQKFIYHYLLSRVPDLQALARATSVKLPQLTVGDTDHLRVPVPPLEVQREIVQILDTFTELEAELKAELEARRRQYAYYRSSLLTATEADVTFAALGDLFEMRAGSFMPAAAISVVRDAEHQYPCFGGGGLRGYVAEPNQNGDRVLIGRQGALCGNVKRSSGEFYATEHAVVVAARPQVDISWAFHMLTAMNLNQYASKSAQPGLAVRNLERLRIPVLAYGEQRRVGSILDGFDALVNDLSIGLPAELNARRKQYEFYRDRLLTFPEAA
jgi:type I restriction enzyme S subunit